jgi:hypothetical protein
MLDVYKTSEMTHKKYNSSYLGEMELQIEALSKRCQVKVKLVHCASPRGATMAMLSLDVQYSSNFDFGEGKFFIIYLSEFL